MSRHHYVAQWYQEGFLADPPLRTGKRLQYLDMAKPWSSRKDRNPTLRGPSQMFYVDDLYRLVLPGVDPESIERLFFGPIDSSGALAIRDRIVKFDYKAFHEKAMLSQPRVPFLPLAWQIDSDGKNYCNATLDYMGTQMWRSPLALIWLSKQLTPSLQEPFHLQVLKEMMKQRYVYQAMWCEAQWEIVEAKNSDVKFLLTDSPIVHFNPAYDPALGRGLFKAPYSAVGTRLIFPLSRDYLLIATHVDKVRDRGINPKQKRINARTFAGAMFNTLNIQRGRQFTTEQVIMTNYIMKKLAFRYIAADEIDWLTPEKYLKKNQKWNSLDKKFFLDPDPRKYSWVDTMYWGGTGFVGGTDEYGRLPVEKRKDAELWRKYCNNMRTWDEKFGRHDYQRPYL